MEYMSTKINTNSIKCVSTFQVKFQITLDSETESEINKTLETLTKNKTTITIAHKLSTIVNSDQIILFNKGKIVGIGSHKELIKSSNYYKKLYNLGT